VAKFPGKYRIIITIDMDVTNKKLKIAVLVRRFVTTGGMERYCVEVTKRLARSHDVHVFAQEWSWQGPERISFHKVPRYFLKPNFLNQLFFSIYTAKILDDSFDIIHSHERVTRFDTLTVHCPCFRTYITEEKRPFKKALLWLSIAMSPRKIAYVLLEKRQFAYNGKRMLIAVSGKVKNNVRYCYTLPNDFFGLAFPGVDSSILNTNSNINKAHELRSRLGIPENDLVILFVGTEFERKGLDALLKGFQQISRSDIWLVIAGGGEKHSKYGKMVRDLGITDRVKLLGLVSDIEKVYAASDIFILPTLSEPAGMAPVEAMAAGLPVIISNAEYAGCAELIKNDEALLLNDPKNPNEIADAINALMDERKRIELGQKGRQLAENLTWDKTTEDTLAVYNKILKLKGG